MIVRAVTLKLRHRLCRFVAWVIIAMEDIVISNRNQNLTAAVPLLVAE